MRPVFLRLATAVVLLAVAACGSRDPRPNVVLVVWDSVRADRCSVNGYERRTTPVLERVAADGVTFSNAWSPGGWTGPAHSSLFTGLAPDRHGFLLENRLNLEDSETTLAELLGAAGYRTACLTNNTWIGSATGLSQGFSIYDSVAARPGAEYPTCRWQHRRLLQIAREAKEDGVPFFVFLNEMEAHLPYTPIQPFQDRFVDERVAGADLEGARRFDTPDAANHIVGRDRVSGGRARILSDLYDAEIAGVDAELATLVEGLAAAGLLDDTLLVVTADHGENLGDHGLFGHKVSLHRSVCNVPLVIRFPGVFEGGRVVRDLVRLEDLFPTILEVCGVPVPEGIDALSLTGDLRGRVSRGAWGRAGGNLEVPEAADGADLTPFTLSVRSVFDGRHHLLSYSDGRVELFDVAEDPGEGIDRSAARPRVVDRLRRLLTGGAAE